MYEQEEQSLSKLKNDLKKISLPIEKADEAILSGFLKAKREKIWLRKNKND